MKFGKSAALDSPRSSSHPIVFLFLILPFGIMSGYLIIAIGYELSKAGFSLASIAELVAISYIPHTWKFLWAPVADITMTRKKWYIITAIISAAGIFITGAIPPELKYFSLFSIVILISNLAVTFVSMSTESIIAYTTSENDKGRASGWFQAGNLGGQGLGGGFGLWMEQNFSAHWIPGTVLGIICILCCFALFFISEPAYEKHQHHEKKIFRSVFNVIKDLWGVTRSHKGYLALLICFLPIGTAAASNLWSAVAGDWKASAVTVELATGLLSGIISAAGCIAGGYICDRIDKKTSYGLFGLSQALCAIAMALAPRTEIMFIVFTSLYSFLAGLSYAGFSAVTFEAIGRGAVATKYSFFASLSNMPIAYMTLVDGWAHSRWGSSGMLNTEAFICMIALLLFAAVVMVVRRSVTNAAVLSSPPSD